MKDRDQHLLERIYSGDRGAETDLIRQFDPIIRHKIRHAVHPDSGEVDDLVAEVHLAVLQCVRAKKIKMERDDALGAYIYGITRNKIYDYYAKTRRDHSLLSLTEHDLVIVEELRVERIERERILRKELERLPGKYQRVLYLRFYKDFSVSEIADQLNLPPRRVSERIHYAIKVLKKQSKKKLSIFFRVILIV
jgi:RNA polymerase sigma-70 factor (ECF subfamily)